MSGNGEPMRFPGRVMLLVAAMAAHSPAPAAEAPDRLLVLLTDTGEERDGLPVLEVHPGAQDVAAGLRRGMSGVLLQIYRLEQAYLEKKLGTRPEPAYVLLSGRQGGFAREGFFLGGEEKKGAGYVDLHRDWPVTGRFGAMDQIFPHELAHVMRRQLAGPLAEGGTNQVHALGVRTDRIVAFNEGFAEHLQVLAIDHPDADPATRALARDPGALDRVERQLRDYRRELTASMAFATRMRMGFVAWFSNGEDVLRYFAVRANAFAREPRLPEQLLTSRDPYPAYLLESVLPGDTHGPAKPLSRMISSEGVVSALFQRWVTSGLLQDRYRDDPFYEQFGVRADQVSPLENVYLKLIHVLYVHKPQDTLAMIEGYQDSFPEEAAVLDGIASEVFMGQDLEAPPEIWLANPDFRTGTTLFDQFRGLPRTHTFDLNAASPVDLAGVAGIDRDLARAIAGAAPYRGIEELTYVPGMNEELVSRFRRMAEEMERLRAQAAQEDAEETLSLKTILMPYVWRLIAALVLASAVGALLHGLVRFAGPARSPAPAVRRPWLRATINGAGAALVGLVSGWAAAGAAGLASVAAVALVFGLPAMLRSFRKTHRWATAIRVLAAWLAAAVPAGALVTPWF